MTVGFKTCLQTIENKRNASFLISKKFYRIIQITRPFVRENLVFASMAQSEQPYHQQQRKHAGDAYTGTQGCQQRLAGLL